MSRHNERCARCGGLVVSVGDAKYLGWVEVPLWDREPPGGPMWECVNCGACVDRVIRANQAHQGRAVSVEVLRRGARV